MKKLIAALLTVLFAVNISGYAAVSTETFDSPENAEISMSDNILRNFKFGMSAQEAIECEKEGELIKTQSALDDGKEEAAELKALYKVDFTRLLESIEPGQVLTYSIKTNSCDIIMKLYFHSDDRLSCIKYISKGKKCKNDFDALYKIISEQYGEPARKTAFIRYDDKYYCNPEWKDTDGMNIAMFLHYNYSNSSDKNMGCIIKPKEYDMHISKIKNG